MQTKQNFWYLVPALVLAMFSVSCGSNNPPPALVVQNQGVPNNPWGGYGNYNYGSCPIIAGNIRRCEFNVVYPGSEILGYPSNYRRLTPSTPNNGSSYVGVPLKAGDQVVIQASGGWSEIDSFFYVISESACDDNNLSGSGSPNHEGMPRGLMASNGSSVWLLGNSSTTTVPADGQLYVGFNSPWTEDPNCFFLDISQLVVKHCEDATSGATVTCPF